MKKILFPIDFSKTSLNAFAYALHFADMIKAEIITLHAYDFPNVTPIDYNLLKVYYNVTVWDEFEKFKGEVPKLRIIAEEENLEHIVVSHMLQKGNAVDTILDIANKENVDYIIMGTNGASGLLNVFLGSVTENVINRSVKPVLAIPANCYYRPMKNILFLAHYKNPNRDALSAVKALVEPFQVGINVLEVKPRHDDDETNFMELWRVQHQEKSMRFYCLISNDIEGTVIDFIDLHQIDMVAMPVHHKGFIKKIFAYSLSAKLGFHSAIPILGMPQQDN